MAKYIDAEKIRAEIERRKKEHMYDEMPITIGRYYEDRDLLAFIDSLQQEQPEFPTTDEQIKEFLAAHPEIKVPNKYKTPDWLWKKQEQPEVDLEKEIERVVEKHNSLSNGIRVMKPSGVEKIARHFYELGKNARKEE